MAPVDSRDYVLSAIYYSVLVRNTCQESLANKFIHLLEEHSELFKLQKDLHNAIKKRDKTNFLDELLENYQKQYRNDNDM